jgi:ubiquinone/menaquinone biosynthesis C-methylase UbiE/ADP-ribose pyrophosphatase YjhB (NUDIX family)
MPDLISAALFERDGVVLTAHRSPSRPPFANQWLLPMTVVGPLETAEEALERHAREQFGIDVDQQVFVDTVYMEDPDDKHRYVANIFRAGLGGAPMRFRADGDYDDARWLTAPDLESLWMPPALREPLVRILTDPDASPAHEWTVDEDARPLAERDDVAVEPAPDNRAAWEAVAAPYQQLFGERDAGRLKWTRGTFEDELRLLDDVHGQRAIVLGCGCGRDNVALERLGAVAVGVDTSPAQIAYAKKYAQRHGAQNSSFVEGSMEDLTRFDDESFDVAVSIHALHFVDDLERTIAEAARVVKHGGVFAFSVTHPLNTMAMDDAPYGFARSYFASRRDHDVTVGDVTARFREHTPTLGRWFTLLADAGFAVERVEEPYLGDLEGDEAGELDMRRARLLPYALIIKARKR